MARYGDVSPSADNGGVSLAERGQLHSSKGRNGHKAGGGVGVARAGKVKGLHGHSQNVCESDDGQERLCESAVRLNLGAGDTNLDGFINIDRKLGTECYPLDYPDNSVDEIRASHVLEHFSFMDSIKAMEDWVRALKPGGVIRVSVPDARKIMKMADEDDDWIFYMMGGQTDADNFHRSAFDEKRLRQTMEHAGLSEVECWDGDLRDTSQHACSLNLQGRKPVASDANHECKGTRIRIMAYMTLPRYEAVVARSIIEGSLRECGIPLATSQGVFWGQCMQRMFEDAIAQGCDWILSIDSDSLFNADHVRTLLNEFGAHPEIDAMAALQCRRGTPFPLMTAGHAKQIEVGSLDPILATTAHFGLTLIRVSSLTEIPKPWFVSRPDDKGEWGDDRLDDDIWFWHQWRLAGKNIYIAPRVSIGHLEETVACFDEFLQPKHEYIHQWREKHLNVRQSCS